MDSNSGSARMQWARAAVRSWNSKQEPFVPWELAEEALIAFFLYQHTRSTEQLLRHDEYARRLPARLREQIGAIAAWRE